MPCSEKWKNKTMRRVPLGAGGLTMRGGGIGRLRGQPWRGHKRWNPDLVTYQPGCPPIVAPGVHYSFDFQGVYSPCNIYGGVPVDCPRPLQPPPCEPTSPRWPDGTGCRTPCDPHDEVCPPWWQKAGHCCESCAYGRPCDCGCGDRPRGHRHAGSHKAKKSCCASCAAGGPCEGGCGDACTCGKEGKHATKRRGRKHRRGVGQSTAPRPPRRARLQLPPGNGRPRNGSPHWLPPDGGGTGGPCGGCDPSLGLNPNRTGCAPGTRPQGVIYGFQRHSSRWPREHRRAPYPIPQRPYYIGMPINMINEPFAGCPNCGCCYYIDPTCQ